MKNVIITGSTGMVGKGVLLECLESEQINKVLLINRRPIGMKHQKLEEVILNDFSNLHGISDQLFGFDACFHCMGVSSVGMSEVDYSNITFDITKTLVDTLYNINPQLIFNYVTGTGTDSSESGHTMWARVKGKTENYILNKGFRDAYMFRPGAIIPEKGIKSSTGWYNALYILTRPLFPLFRLSKNITTTTKLGQAMINTLYHQQQLKHLEGRDINALAQN
jgi:nucleoside-diphosphate-sugar epimerase